MCFLTRQTSLRLLPVVLAASATVPSHAQAPTAAAAPSITGVRIDGPSMIYPGQSAQLKAIASYSDNTTKDMTAAASWSALQNSVGKLSSGLLTGMNPGAVSAHASIGGVEAATPVLVNTNHMIQIYPTMSQGQIQDQINQSSVGDALYFNAGTYRVTTQPAVGLSLLPGRTYFGSLNGPAVLSGTGGYELIRFSGSGLVLQNFTFDGGGISFAGPVSHVNVEYNTFRNIDAHPNYDNQNTTQAIFLDTGASDSDFSYNTFTNIGGSVLNQFQDQWVAGGMLGYGLSNTTIEHNTFDHFDEGIHILYRYLDGNNVKIDYNTFTNGHRIAIEQQNGEGGHAQGLEVAYNNVSNPLNPWALTYALSIVPDGGTDVSVHDNFLNGNMPVAPACQGSGCHYGYGIESSGLNAQVFNNIVVGNWIQGVAIEAQGNIKVVNNILCGPVMAQQGFVAYEHGEHGATIQGNTTSPSMTCGR